ncbi:hypothetical protein [Sphingomonas faeni]|uniref:hypothetical protein n=1 Tax=Sphingomonas faeni TaxID=185950 RepID=UPI003357E5BC
MRPPAHFPPSSRAVAHRAGADRDGAGGGIADPDWLAHRYDPVRDDVHFIAADRAMRRAATFLTDENLPSAADPLILGRRDATGAIGAISQRAPVHFIFHSAYCCSTLLAQAFDHVGFATTLKEPVILNDLVGWRHRGGNPAKIADVLDSVLTLLARGFIPGEAVIIKPSNVVNALAPTILTIRPEARAVLLYAPLRVFLTSIARKGMWGRLWVRELLAKQLADGMVDLGFAPEEYFRLTDLQVAAVGWIAQADLFAALAAQFPGRVRSLQSETLVAAPRVALAAISTLYGLATDTDSLDALVDGGAFARNAKDGTAYRATDRTREQIDGAALYADEIDKVLVWAEAVAQNAGVTFDPPAPLLG